MRRPGLSLALAGLSFSLGLAVRAQSAALDAQADAMAARYMTSVPTELVGKVDSKSAAAGQQITLKTRKDVRLADDTLLPKGTLLQGHVLRAQAQGSGRAAILVVNFDQAVVKPGQPPLKVRTLIRALAPVGYNPAAGDSMSRFPSAGMGGGYPVQNRGGLGAGEGAGGLGDASAGGIGGPSGGGLGGNPGGGLGGNPGGGLGGNPGMGPAGSPGMGPAGYPGTRSSDGGVIDGTTLPGDRSSGPFGGTADQDPMSGGPATRGVAPVVPAGESTSAAPRPTAMPGVMLSTAAAGGASGALVASERNITLDSGTQITLGVIAR